MLLTRWHLDRHSLCRKHRKLTNTVFYYYQERFVRFKKIFIFITFSLSPIASSLSFLPASFLTLICITLKEFQIHSRHLYKNVTRKATYVKRNSEGRSCNHCCSDKAISITYSECVFVAFYILRAMRMRHIILSSVS